MQGGRRAKVPFYLLYADDILLFGRVTRQNLKVIMDAFWDYGLLFGQKVSWAKSYIYFGSIILAGQRQLLASLCGIRLSQFPFTFQGALLLRGFL